jgi:guanylate kinase
LTFYKKYILLTTDTARCKKNISFANGFFILKKLETKTKLNMETKTKSLKSTTNERLEKEFKRVQDLFSKKLKNIGVIIAGPSGVGKTTNSLLLQNYFPNLTESISVTTRSIREGEKDGKDYFFESKEKFNERVKNNEFAEFYNPFEKDSYGTLKSQCDISQGSKIFVVDVMGARNLMQLYPHFVTIFIQPPSTEILEERLRGRNDGIDEKELEKRLKRYEFEKEFEREAKYTVVNDDRFDCFAELAAIIFQEMGGVIIAEDGLTATGKGTLARTKAEKLNGLHVDSGLFYRIITKELGIIQSIDISEVKEQLLNDFILHFDFANIFNDDYRTPEVDNLVPKWSKVPLIRKYTHYLEIKKVYSQTNPVVIVEGRDMYRVFSRAKYKFYIECDIEIRALRRAAQQSREFGFVYNEIANRDKQDIERLTDPVRFVPEIGVVRIINEGSPEEALLEMLSYIK